MAEAIGEPKAQTVQYGSHTVKIPTRLLQGIDCLCLQDVQQQFPLVTVLRMNDMHIPFLCDEQGELLKPLRIVARFDSVIEALEPVGQSNSALSERFDRIDQSMKQLQVTSDQTLANTQEMLKQIKSVMRLMYELQEYSTPHYFFIYPVTNRPITSMDEFCKACKLFFLCECSDEPDEMHVPLHPGYPIKNPREFLEKYGKYLLTTIPIAIRAAELGRFQPPRLKRTMETPLAIEPKAITDVPSSEKEGKTFVAATRVLAKHLPDNEGAKKMVEYTNKAVGVLGRIVPEEYHNVLRFCARVVHALIIAAPKVKTLARGISNLSDNQKSKSSQDTTEVSEVFNDMLHAKNKRDYIDSLTKNAPKFQKTSLQGPQLREVQSYLTGIDQKRTFGNLHRTFTSDGHVRWVCQEHYGDMCHVNENDNILSDLNAMGGTYNDQTHELIIVGANLTTKNVKRICNSLEKGFNIQKLTLQDTSLNDDDFDTLIKVISKYNSFPVIKLIRINVRNRLGMAKYKCDYALVQLGNKSIKIRFNNYPHECNIQILERFLFHSQGCDVLNFSASDFLDYERDFRQCIDTIGKVKRLVVYNANNADILQAISKLKKHAIRELALRNSLRIPAAITQFCKLVEETKALIEIDLLDDIGFADDDFIKRLIGILNNHSPIKKLSLHVTSVNPSSPKELILIHLVRDASFSIHLCISDSVISHPLAQGLINAAKASDSLLALEFYLCEMNDNSDLKKLKSLNVDEKKKLIWSKSPRPCTTSQEEDDEEDEDSEDEEDEDPRTEHRRHSPNATWDSEGVTVAGNGISGDELDQLNSPHGLYIEDDLTLLIADRENHRIVEWKSGVSRGRVIAGGNGQGNQNNQLNRPTALVVHDNATIFICDSGNKRVMRWPRRDGIVGEVIIENISCRSLSLSGNNFLYVSDNEKHEVRRYRIGDKNGIVVAGGHGKGNRIDQLSSPSHFAVDLDQSVYVSDYENHRVTKWTKGAKEVLVVAGGQGSGSNLNQVSYPNGLYVDQLGTLYVTEFKNPRVTRWCKGAKEGTVIAGENEFGNAPNMLSGPEGITFDRDGNLYVADSMNHRVQRFFIKNRS